MGLEGDRVAENFLDAFGVQAYPLQLVDVNTGLEKEMIYSLYYQTLISAYFQWCARVQFMLDFPMVNSTGALLMNKGTFYSLSPKNRETLICLELVLRYFSNSSRRWATVMVNLFSALVMGILLVTSVEFVKNEIAMFGAWGRLSIIFTIFFNLAAFRYLTSLLYRFASGQPVDPILRPKPTR